MTQKIEITAKWDEVAGEVVGHIVGLPEAVIHAPEVEAFIENARTMLSRFGYADRDVVFTNERHETLDLAA